MLVAAAVCPHPPLLVPAVATGAAAETADLRAACVAAVRRLAGTDVPQVVVVGAATEAGEWDGSAGGQLRGFGCDAACGGPDLSLPLSLTVGAYLLDEAGVAARRRRFVAVSSETPVADCALLGRRLARDSGPVAVLVMADGSAKRTRTSPGYLDERAVGYDAHVVAALEKADPDPLLALGAEEAAQLWAAGRPGWQVLAGAAQAAYDDGASISTAVRYDEAPFGVGYAVVEWSLRYPG